MALWTNIIFAWIALILSFLLIIIWLLRLICKNKKPRLIFHINRYLRRHHKLIGILLILSGVIHGFFSSDKLLSLNWGTALWFVSILLGLNWLFRNKLRPKWMTYHRILTAVFAVLVVIHIVDVGGFILDDMIAGDVTSPQQINETAETDTAAPYETTISTDESETPVYIDGTYTGTGTGYNPGLTVEVVIEDGLIVSVTIIEHNEEKERYWGYPVEAIPEAIVEAQSTDVDSISGATMTSEGIKEAVDDALSKALSE